MKLSIIVPVYNMASEGKLNFCLDSLVNQSLEKDSYEIIAIDDASTDNSFDILKGYEERYKGLVKVLRHDTNRRQGGAKNTGLDNARGEWIGFIDSDDWVSRDFYEKLLNKAMETGADLVGCDYNLVNSHTFEVGKIVSNNTSSQGGVLDYEKHKSHILRSGSMVIKIYKRAIIEENALRFPEGIFYEDNCAGPLWSLYFTHFEKIDEPLYYYYQHEVSTVHKITKEKCDDRMMAAKLLVTECKDRKLFDKYKAEIEYRFCELFFVNTLFSYMQGVRNPQIGYIRKMREGILELFPEFYNNKYYKENVGAEEQKYIKMLLSSVLGFYVNYRLKFFYRKLRSRIGI